MSPHPPPLPKEEGTARHLFLGGFVAVVALGAVLRLLWLDRFPPGLHYDEAAYGLQAMELLAHPRLEPFFPAFTGREPLFIYVAAGAFWLFGPSVFVLRLVAALVGAAAVAATGLVGRALFGRGVGLLAGALLATSFWHVAISRMAYRAGLVALVAPLAIWLLWRAWQQPSIGRGALAGATWGALAYTYVSVRLLPLALLAFATAELVAGPLRCRRRVVAAAVFLVAGSLVAAPLLLYFSRHPEDFAVRFSQTATVAGESAGPAAATLAQGIADTLQMYGLRGDILQKYNLPLRPALDPLLSLLLVAGVARLLRGIGESRSRLVLCWLVGALAPGFVTADSPNFLRLIGAAPPSYLVAALGASALWQGAARWIGTGAAPVVLRELPTTEGSLLQTEHPAGARILRSAQDDKGDPQDDRGARRGWSVRGSSSGALMPLGLAALLIVGEGALTARAYFRSWAPSTATYYALDGDLADLGRLARAQPSDVTLYASSEHYRHPTTAFTAGAAFDRLRWFDGRTALPLPPPRTAAGYLVPRSARPPEPQLLGSEVASAVDPAGAPSVVVWRRDGGAGGEPTARDAVGLAFAPDGADAPVAELVGLDPPGTARAGDLVRLRSVWRLLANAPLGSLDFFAHALDADGRRWGQRDASPYLTAEWRQGETLVVWLDVPIDPTAPAGTYRLRVGLNDPGRGQALVTGRADGVPGPAEVLTAPFAVGHAAAGPMDERLLEFRRTLPGGARLVEPPSGDLALARPGESSSDGQGRARLLAAAYSPTIAAGETAPVDLLWQATADAPRGVATLLLRAGDGSTQRAIGERRLEELDQTTPWQAGETQRDARQMAPTRADAGRWTLLVRLDERELPLGEVEVTAPAADFAPPTPQHPTQGQFGDVARVLGFDVAPGSVRLYWQAIGPAAENYTVFVHALDASDHILAQNDAQPAGGVRPTRGWTPGEIVRDDHLLVLPPGTRALAVGLYDARTGQRVPLKAGGDRVVVPVAGP